MALAIGFLVGSG
jgi:integrase/recombinase XerC